MDSSRKQFKAFNMAQPIKKQINETLTKLQAEKRKFLSLQRQQMGLKDQLQRAQRQLNEVKMLQPKARVKQNKNLQTNISINNTDRLYLNTVNKISEFKTKIDVHRKQIQKYKRLAGQIHHQVDRLEEENNFVEANLLKQYELCQNQRKDKNQTIKAHLLDYRTLNMRNTDEFKNSFNALHRSSVKEENERRKSSALKKSFQFEELKNSNLIRLTEVVQQVSKLNAGVQTVQRNELYMTNCIPLVKERIRVMIHKNREKIRISENYKKFGDELESMFSVMKEYKGRDDVGFIADQFVMKEKQLKKIQEYIGKLENRLMLYRTELEKIKNSDQKLLQELSQDQNQEGKIKEKHFIQLQNQLINSIQQLKRKQFHNTQWFNKIGAILAALVDEESINRGNIDKALALIEERYFIDQKKTVSQVKEEKQSKSPTKAGPVPSIDQKQMKSIASMQLMSYEKLKEYAKEYVTRKR